MESVTEPDIRYAEEDRSEALGDVWFLQTPVDVVEAVMERITFCADLLKMGSDVLSYASFFRKVRTHDEIHRRKSRNYTTHSTQIRNFVFFFGLSQSCM